MKAMRCERANDLLPLYAAGDLEDASAQDVAAHVSSCDECRARAAQFEEGRALLAEACEPPEFGEEFYAGIRGAVLTEIARAPGTPSKPSPLAALLPTRRLVFASTLALLLLASIVVIRLFGGGRETRRRPEASTLIARDKTQERARAPQTLGEKAAGNANAPAPTMRSPSRTAPSAKSRAVAVVGDGSGSRAPSVRFGRTPGKSTSAELDRREANAAALVPKEDGSAEVAAAQRESVDPVRAAASTPATAAPANAESKVSRIEIQTADPNIRIIWLTPLKTDEPARDHDNQENGDRN